jgi:ketosteroid isomerase-like protein
VELVRSIYAAWKRGDFSSVEWAHSEIDFVFADGAPRGSWKGFAGMAKGWRDYLSAWEGYRVEPDEYRELDDGRVLVLIHQYGRGKTSGMELGEIRAKGACVFHFDGGKVTKLVIYEDRQRAFTDLGLASEAGSPRP